MVYFIQAGAPFCIENAKCWPILAHLGNFSRMYALLVPFYKYQVWEYYLGIIWTGHRQMLVGGPDESKLALQYLFLRAIDIAFRIFMISGGHQGIFFGN